MIGLPLKAESLFVRSIKRVRLVYLLRGVLASLAVFLSAVLAVMAVDAKWPLLPDGVRWALSGALYVVTLAAVAVWIIRPLAGKLDARKIAKVLDDRHEDHEECLTTLVELCESRKNLAAASPSLVRLLAERAEVCAAKINVESEFTFRSARRRLVALLFVLPAFAAFFAISPRLGQCLLMRALAPWADVGNMYSDAIEVKPGDITALSGDKIKIEATVDGDFGYEPFIRISRRTTLGWGEESMEPMKSGAYTATADITDREWRYRISAGPAVTRYFTVKVYEKPQCRSFKARIEYPLYTALGSVTVSNEAISSIRAIEGSRVTFLIELDHSASKADFRIGGRNSRDWAAVSNSVARWSLVLENEAGFRSRPRHGVLESVLDIPPSVLIESPKKNVKSPPHAKIPFVVTASDDIGIITNSLVVRTDNGPWREVGPLEKFTSSGPSFYKGEDELDLSLFDLEGARALSFAVTVADACPNETLGSHCVTSAPVVVTLETRAETLALQSLAEEKKRVRSIVDEIRRRLRSMHQPVAGAKAMIAREKKAGQKAEREIAKAAHEAREIGKRLGEMREKTAKEACFKPLAEDVSGMADRKIAPILDRLSAAQFASSEERIKALAEVEGKLREALEDIKKIEESFKNRFEELENHERLEDLAMRQKALARRAAEIEQAAVSGKENDPRAHEAWKRLQHEAAGKARMIADIKNDAELDEARRTMEKSADLMDEARRRLEARARHCRNEEAFKRYEEERERAVEKDKVNAMKQALGEAKNAEQHLKRALGMNMPRPAADAIHRAMTSQRNVQDAMEKALQEGEARLRQHEAEKAARKALEAAGKARGVEGKRDESSRKAFEAASAEMDNARREAVKAQESARKLLEKAYADAKRDEVARDAAEKAAQAKAALDKAALSHALAQRAAEEKVRAEKAARDAARKARSADKESVEAGKAADKAARESAEKARSTRAAADRDGAVARKLARENAVMAKEEAVKAEEAKAAALRAAGESQGAAAAAKESEEISRKAAERAAQAEAAAKNVDKDIAGKARKIDPGKMDEAQGQGTGTAEGEDVPLKETVRPGDAKQLKNGRETGVDGDRKDDERMDDTRPGRGSVKARHGGGNRLKGRKSASGKAREASDILAKRLREEAERLGLDEEKPSNDENDDSSSGGFAEELKRRMRELEGFDPVHRSAGFMLREGWFRIKGAAKDGLGERSFEDVPPEYRDLVMQYFLKLAEEAK